MDQADRQKSAVQTPGMQTPGLPEGYDARDEAITLLRTLRAGTLATIAGDGFPFASLVNVATAMDGAPVLLLSGLSAHTQNLLADARASLLLAKGGKGDPLAHPRLTVTGTLGCITDEPERSRLKSRFLARHPKSALYADFGDFGFWKMDVVHGHLNGGFAKAARFDAPALLTSLTGAEELEALENDALAHLNNDHNDAVQYYASTLPGLKRGRWRAVALDPEGLDLASGDQAARLSFPAPVHTGAELRKTLAALAKRS